MTADFSNERIQRFVKRIQEGELTRRGFIKQATALGISGSFIAIVLAACGGDDDDDTGDDDTGGESSSPTAETGSGGQATEAATEGGAEGEATPSDSGESSGEATQGGEIIIGTLGEAQSINPFLTNETEGQWRANMLFDQFLYIDPETFEPKPRLAKDWNISDDGTEYTFTLQDGVQFSDGTPLTANDIAFFFQGVLGPDSASPFIANFSSIEGAPEFNDGSADSISGIEVVDDQKLLVRLSEPNAAFIVNLENVRPVPSAALEGKSLKDDPFFQEPVGAGPFVFDSWQTGGDFVAVRNDNYWQQGKPYLDKFTHRVIADSQTLVLSLETGEIDASNYPAPTVAERLQDSENLDVIVPPFTEPDGWSFNLEHDALQHLEVRKAIAYSLNMDQYVSDFLLGLGEVGIGPIAPGNWAFNQDLKPLPYDPDQAKQLMADAGFPDGGFSVEFTTNQGNILREDFLTFTQAALEPLGIEAKANLTEWTQVVEAATNGTFESICPTWSGATVEPDDLYLTLHTDSASNVYHYSNTEVDDLLEKARVETDQDARKEMYGRVQEILMEEVPIFWAWYRPFIHVTQNRFKGYTDSNLTGGLFVGLENWYVEG